jgi:hypothetical protein
MMLDIDVSGWTTRQAISFVCNTICGYLNMVVSAMVVPKQARGEMNTFLSPFHLSPFVSLGMTMGPFYEPTLQGNCQAVALYSILLHDSAVISREEVLCTVLNSILGVLDARNRDLGNARCLLIDRHGCWGVPFVFFQITMLDLGFDHVAPGLYRKWLHHLPPPSLLEQVDAEAAEVLKDPEDLACHENMVH